MPEDYQACAWEGLGRKQTARSASKESPSSSERFRERLNILSDEMPKLWQENRSTTAVLCEAEVVKACLQYRGTPDPLKGERTCLEAFSLCFQVDFEASNAC